MTAVVNAGPLIALGKRVSALPGLPTATTWSAKRRLGSRLVRQGAPYPLGPAPCAPRIPREHAPASFWAVRHGRTLPTTNFSEMGLTLSLRRC